MKKLMNHLSQWCLIDIDDLEHFNRDIERGLSKGWITRGLAEQWFELDLDRQESIFRQLKEVDTEAV